MDNNIPIVRKRLRGISIVIAIYGIQLVALRAILYSLQLSVLQPVVALFILVVGWLAGGLTLAETVVNRSWGGMRFAVGLGAALFLSLLLVVGVIEYLNDLPPTYNGP